MSDTKELYNNHKETPYDHPSYTQRRNPPPYDEVSRERYPAVPEAEQRFQNGAPMPHHPQYQYQVVGENASYYKDTQSQYSQNNATTGEPNDERGFGPTVIGGLAGGYVANQMGAGPMGTTGGAIIGATGTNMATSMLQNNQSGSGTVYSGGYGSITTTTTTTSPGVGGIGPLRLGGLGQARFARRAIRRQRLGLF